jgi:glycosyltransferase involved in cell wall biosynthesis
MKISVCVATYNGAAYINEQLRSVLPQLGEGDEIIISDDRSTDDTLESIRALGDSRIQIVPGPRKGLVKNFENALSHASGDYIFLCDQDDVWLPGKVEQMIKTLQSCSLAVSDCRVVDKDLHTLESSFLASRGAGRGVLKNLVRNSYIGCCMAFRGELLEKALPFPEGIPMHDWWLGLIAELFGSVKFMDEPLLLYRRHGKNASETSQKSATGRYTQARWRLKLMAALTGRLLRQSLRGLRHPA